MTSIKTRTSIHLTSLCPFWAGWAPLPAMSFTRFYKTLAAGHRLLEICCLRWPKKVYFVASCNQTYIFGGTTLIDNPKSGAVAYRKVQWDVAVERRLLHLCPWTAEYSASSPVSWWHSDSKKSFFLPMFFLKSWSTYIMWGLSADERGQCSKVSQELLQCLAENEDTVLVEQFHETCNCIMPMINIVFIFALILLTSSVLKLDFWLHWPFNQIHSLPRSAFK